MKENKVEKQLQRVNEEEAFLGRKRKILERIDIQIQQNKLKPLVGMAFKRGNTYFMITDVPQVEWEEEKMVFSPYELPCLMLRSDGDGKTAGKESRTIFSNAVDSVDVQAYIRKEYLEIPKELFEEKLRETEN